MNENDSIHHRFTLENHKGKITDCVLPLFGWLMIGHFGFVAVRSYFSGTPEDLFWISHIGTLLGGIAALLRNRSLASMALVSIAGHHLFWLVDTAGWWISGQFPFGTTTYLKEADWADWLQSANHFFSVPFLLWIVYRLGGVKPYSWIWSTAVFALLSCISFFFLPAQANVNSAHDLWPGLDQTNLSIFEKWPWGFYWIALVVLNGLGNYLPTNLVLLGVYAVI
ncbi:MAG: hypothetical protein JRF72_01265, partial [Deltaproteobacteria bacterium]|nr:hypothetical protein [Deltaproteobacteria bacterium]